MVDIDSISAKCYYASGINWDLSKGVIIIRLLIIDEDVDFRRRFSGCLAAGCRDISITAAGGEGLEDLISQGADYIIFDEMISESLKDSIMNSGISGTELCWEEGRDRKVFSSEDSQVTGVYKFQEVTGIIKAISPVYDLAAGWSLLSEASDRVRTYGIAGFTGGCGRTSLAVSMARLIRQKTGQGVVIVSTAPESDLYNYFPPPEGDAGADINLLLLNYISGQRVKSSSFIINDQYNVSTLRPSAGRASDLAGLGAEEFKGFIEYIKEWNIFGTVIIDMDNAPGERNSGIFDICDEIFVIHDDRRHPEGAEIKWLERNFGNMDEKRIHRILNYDVSGELFNAIFCVEEESGALSYEGRLSADPDSFFIKDGICDISMSGQFAAGVDTVCRRLGII